MSMLDVAKYLSYSRSVDTPNQRNQYFNLSMANSGRLVSCLYSDRRRDKSMVRFPRIGKGA